MKLCIPKIGSMMILTKELTIQIDSEYGFYSFDHLVCVKKEMVAFKDYYGKDATREIMVGSVTFPIGSILRLESIEMWSNKQKRHHGDDCVKFAVIETSLEYKVDKEVVFTKTGRISKLKKERPEVYFTAKEELFNSIEFEFTI